MSNLATPLDSHALAAIARNTPGAPQAPRWPDNSQALAALARSTLGPRGHDSSHELAALARGSRPHDTTHTLAALARTTLGPRGHESPWAIALGSFPAVVERPIERILSAREWPVGFFNPAVGPSSGVPGMGAQATGTVSLLLGTLYTDTGSLVGTSLTFSIDGGPVRHFTAVVYLTPTDFLTALNAFANPFGLIASPQPGTNFMQLTTIATGAATTLTIGGTMLGVLGLTPGTTTGSDPIPSVGAVPIVTNPQITFRGERLVVPSSIAVNFSVLDIKVGNRSQLANSISLPAQMFVEGAVGVRLSLDTATIAQDIAILVQNLTSDSQPFGATLIGSTFLERDGVKPPWLWPSTR